MIFGTPVSAYTCDLETNFIRAGRRSQLHLLHALCENFWRRPFAPTIENVLVGKGRKFVNDKYIVLNGN